MFWQFNRSISQFITILQRDDSSTDEILHELLDLEDVICECRAQNKALIDFFIKPEVLSTLVEMSTKQPTSDTLETNYKYPNIACELLTCDVPAINETLAGNPKLMETLYKFLESEGPLNPLLASYFSKILGGLIAKKTEQNWLSYQLTCLQVLDFLKERENFLSLMLKHIGTSAIMDLMLKLLTSVEGIEMRHNNLKWLDSEKLIQQLICLLNPNMDKSRHDNVAQLLCDFLTTARDAQGNSPVRVEPDPLLDTLESPETVSLLLDQIFSPEKCESSIIGGISVLLALLNVNQISVAGFRSTSTIYSGNVNEDSADTEHKQKVLRTTTEAIAARIKDFHQLLIEPPKQSSVLTTVGLLDPPLGRTRLQVLSLLSTLVNSDYGQLHEQLISLNTFSVIVDLFFKYPWNNFLHAQVEKCLAAALETKADGSDDVGSEISILCKHLLKDCDIINRFIKEWQENDNRQKENGGIRQGYMGHLISIMNKIVKIKRNNVAFGAEFTQLNPEAASALEEFETSTLSEVISIQEKLLGGVHPKDLPVDNADEVAGLLQQFSISDLFQNALPQQSFSQFQMQNLSSQGIDGYSGFNDDAFNDGDDTLQIIDNPSDVNFDLSDNDMVQDDTIFKQICQQSINSMFEVDDHVFEDRDQTFQTVIEKLKPAAATTSSDSEDYDEETPPGEDSDPWLSSASKGDVWEDTIISKQDPWNQAAALDSPVDNWADFKVNFFESAANSSFGEERPKAAAGDHEPKTADSNSSNSQVPEPSMNLQGDSCKPSPQDQKEPPKQEQQQQRQQEKV